MPVSYSASEQTSSLAAQEVRMLDLLVADMPPDEFQMRVQVLRQETDLEGEADRLVELAQRLRTMIDAERRHSRVVAALRDTAMDLGSRRDVGDVLRVICRQARALLATDVAYIMLQDDERGDIYVRTTDGVVSEQLQRLRLPSGVGLGTLVAYRGIPLATADYIDDERFAHGSAIDSCVMGEGLHAMVGVPLRRGHKVLGVVLTASRSQRRFEPSEVALLQELANHAAIAIENAWSFAALVQKYAELEAANASVERRCCHVEATARLDQRLALVIVEGGGPADVVNSVGAMVKGVLHLVGVDGAVLARHGDACPAGAPIDVGVKAGPEPLGTLHWWPPNPDEIELSTELLQRSTVIIAGQLLSRRARSEADFGERARLIGELFDHVHVDERRLNRDAARLGISLLAPHFVLHAELSPSATHWTALKAAQAAADGGAARIRDGQLLAIVGGEDAHAVGHAWLELLTPADGQRPTIGLSHPAQGVTALRTAQVDASRALAVLRALGRQGVASVGDLGIFGLVFARAGDGELDAFLERVIGPVLAYDASRRDGRALLTATTYFEHGGHLNNTARALGIHINTLYARLERLSGLLGVDWREGDRALELQLALRLHALNRRLAGDEDQATTER